MWTLLATHPSLWWKQMGAAKLETHLFSHRQHNSFQLRKTSTQNSRFSLNVILRLKRLPHFSTKSSQELRMLARAKKVMKRRYWWKRWQWQWRYNYRNNLSQTLGVPSISSYRNNYRNCHYFYNYRNDYRNNLTLTQGVSTN